MNAFFRDFRYSGTLLAKSPTFTTAVVLSLAIGIGANAAVFSLISGVLLKPLPFTNPEKLVALWERPSKQRPIFWEVSGPTYKDWTELARAFDGLSAFTQAKETTLITNQGAERITLRNVTGDFFATLQIKPQFGRWFVNDELGTEERRVAIIGDALWRRHFAARQDVIGQKISVDRESYTVIGVAPLVFESFGYRPADVILPLRFGSEEMSLRDLHFLGVIGRLKSSVPISQAQEQMNAIAEHLSALHPSADGIPAVKMMSLREISVGSYRGLLIILQSAIFFVLLISCTNVASLLLARWTGRQQELAIRAALGATRWSLLRLSICESIILVSCGTLLALWLADVFRRAVLSMAPADIPRIDEVRIDPNVLLSMMVLAACATVFFAVVPLVFSRRIEIIDSLRQGGRAATSGRGRQRLRGFLVASQVMLTVILLSGAGLLIQSLWRLQQIDVGFRAANLLSLHLFPDSSRYRSNEEIASYYSIVFDRIRSLPGIGEVCAVSHLPFTAAAMGNRISHPGRAKGPGDQMDAQTLIVTPEYFRTFGIRITKGRPFTLEDTTGAPAVVMISEHLARHLFAAGISLGADLEIESSQRLDPDNVHPRTAQIVGIVADGKQWDVTEQPHSVVYIPFAQNPVPSMFVVAQTRIKSSALADSVRGAVLKVDPTQPVYDVQMMTERIRASQLERRFYATLLVLFAIVALIATAVGIYGTLAFWVAQRTHEIGVRIALGASRRQIISLVIRKLARLTLIGVVLGLPASAATVRLIRSFVYQGQPAADIFYGVGSFEPSTMLLVFTVLTVTAIVAIIIPSWRATTVDPATVLQTE